MLVVYCVCVTTTVHTLQHHRYYESSGSREKYIIEFKLTRLLYDFVCPKCVNEVFFHFILLCLQSVYRSVDTLKGCEFACKVVRVWEVRTTTVNRRGRMAPRTIERRFVERISTKSLLDHSRKRFCVNLWHKTERYLRTYCCRHSWCGAVDENDEKRTGGWRVQRFK